MFKLFIQYFGFKTNAYSVFLFSLKGDKIQIRRIGLVPIAPFDEKVL